MLIQSWWRDTSLPTLILLGTTSGVPSLLRVQSTRSKRQLQFVPAAVACPVRYLGGAESPAWEKHHPVFRQREGGNVDLCREGHVEEVLHGVTGGGELGDVLRLGEVGGHQLRAVCMWRHS